MRIWIIVAGWSRTFELRRFCMQVLVVTPLSAALASCGHSVWMLITFVVGFWPFPYHARWSPQGLDVSWLFVRERLNIASITRADIRSGFRHLWIFRYGLVLDIELTGGRRAVIAAAPHALRWLHSEITTALATRSAHQPEDA